MALLQDSVRPLPSLEIFPLSSPPEQLQCCGYFNSTSNGLFTQSTGFCAGPITNVTVIRGCVTPITDFSE